MIPEKREVLAGELDEFASRQPLSEARGALDRQVVLVALHDADRNVHRCQFGLGHRGDEVAFQ